MADSVKIRISGDDSAYRKTLSGLGSVTRSALKGMMALGSAVSAAWGAVGVAGVKYNASIEQLQTSFEVMTGSATKAVEVVGRVKALGASTPFETEGLASTVQLLMNYGVSADTAIAKMMQLGDISQGSQDKLTRIATAFGQMSSAGKVSLEDIKQMIEAGFNPLQEISESTGESMASLYERISKGKLAVSEIAASMERATSAGGKYFQSMEKQSRTLEGRLSTLKDGAAALLGNIMGSAFDAIRDQVIPMATEMIDEFNAAFESGGIDGLIDAVTAKIPLLLDTALNGAKQVTAKLSKWLPGAVKQLAGVMPNAVRAILTLSPQIVSALFEVATTLVSDLITMLPELAPMIIEGIGKLLLSVSEGVLRMAFGIVDSIAGLFVTTADETWKQVKQGLDKDVIADMSAKINADVDASGAETAINNAFSELRTALQTDLLTPEQVAEVEKMIGDDYDKVYAKLKSFGLSDGDAEQLAGKVTTAGKTVMDKLEALNLSVSPQTVFKWILEAAGSKVALIASLQSIGLNEGEISQVAGVFDTMNSDITGRIPNVAAEIYKALTDGEPDSQTVLNDLSALQNGTIGDLLAGVDTWLQDQIAKLDKDSASYSTDVAALTEQAGTYKTEITSLDSEMTKLVGDLAGQPSSVVKKRLDEFTDIESRANALAEKLDLVNKQGAALQQRSYEQTRAGATTNTQTIAEGAQYAYQGYKMDTQAIEDEAKKAKEEADEAWSKGLLSDEEHLAKESEIADQLEKDKARVLELYRTQMSELMQGITEAFSATNPEEAGAVKNIGAKSMILGQMEAFQKELTGQEVTPERRAEMASTLQKMYANLLGQEVEFNPDMLGQNFAVFGKGLLDQMGQELTSLEGKDNPLTTAITGVFESGALSDLGIDTSSVQSVFRAAMGDVGKSGAEGMAGGVTTNSSVVTTAVDDITSNATGAMDVSDDAETSGENTGDGYVKGVHSKLDDAYNAGAALGAAVKRGLENRLQISSPSKVMMKPGEYTGDGFNVGLRKGLVRAVQTARTLMGGLIGAANLSASLPDMTQSITAALAGGTDAGDTSLSLYLSGKKVAEIQADRNRRATNMRIRRLALGVGKS